jgi:hypothetical protein
MGRVARAGGPADPPPPMEPNRARHREGQQTLPVAGSPEHEGHTVTVRASCCASSILIVLRSAPGRKNGPLARRGSRNPAVIHEGDR